MYFVVLGLALITMKSMEFGPVASLSWLWVLSPFALAIAWWSWSDASGFTKRRAMEKELQRKQDRIDANRANLGTLGKSRKGK